MLFKAICLVFTVIFLAVSLGEDPRKSVLFGPERTKLAKAAFATCTAKYGLGEEAVDLIRAGKYKEDDTFKKFSHCAFKLYGGFDENGRMNTAYAAEGFPKELNISKYIEACKQKFDRIDDPIERYHQIFKCFQDTSPVRMQMY